jgi:pyrroline-5-carboxylate reductase
MSTKLALLGAGKLNQALLRGFIRAQTPLRLAASVRTAASAEKLRREFATLEIDLDNRHLVFDAKHTILGVKPQHALAILSDLREDFPKNSTLISLCARLPLSQLRAAIGPRKITLVRLMPNTASETGQGLLGYCVENSKELDDELRQSLEGLGQLLKIDEELMDAFTVLGACTPAFFLRAAENLAQAAQAKGLSERVVRSALAQVLRGAGELLDSPLTAAERIAQIATPGGVTAKGLQTLDEREAPRAFFEAFESSLKKCQGLTHEVAILAGGCFWGMEDLIRKIPGVIATEVGYTGGVQDNPTYQDICTGQTQHAEAVKIIFDPSQVDYDTVLDFFFRIHDPTTANQQGHDVGTQYRSAIFFTTEAQREKAHKKKLETEASGRWKNSIVTEIVPAGRFFKAEEEHQGYLVKNPGGYSCHYLRDE